MGYILPILPIQSQQYVNRMTLEPYDFAYIDRINKAKFNTGFSDLMEDSHAEERERQPQEQREKQRKSINASSAPLYKGFINPNPTNLSPVIASVVGKGISVNVYV